MGPGLQGHPEAIHLDEKRLTRYMDRFAAVLAMNRWRLPAHMDMCG
jgi:hypothetical protein